MKKIIFPLLFAAAVFVLPAQGLQKKADSIENVLNTQQLTPEKQIEFYKNLCVYYMSNDLDKAIYYGEKGLKFSEKERSEEISSFYEFFGRIYNMKGSYDTALVCFNKAAESARQYGSKKHEASAYTGIGVHYAIQGKLMEALDFFTKSLMIHEEIEDDIDNQLNRLMLLGNVAAIHGTLHNLERQFHYLEKARTLAEKMNDDRGMLSVYAALGSYYRSICNLEQAEAYSEKALTIARDRNDKINESAIIATLTKIYGDKKEYDKAMEYAEECLRLAEESKDQRHVAAAWNYLSKIHLYKKQYQESEAAALKAWEIDSSDFLLATNVTYDLIEAKVYLDKKEEVMELVNRYERLYREHSEKNFHESLLETEVKYETEKKELRITALEQQKRLYIWLSVAGAVALLLAFGVLFYRHRMNIQKRKLTEQQVKQLEQEKQLIATQAVLDGETAERARLARDLHDGLGGMLSAVKLNLKDMKGFAIIEGTDVERFSTALEMLDQSIGELRRVAHHMMPESLIRYGLKVSLEDFCRAIPGANFQYFGENPRLDNRLEVVIYRCAYELINNAVKHANPQNINVQLIVDGGLVALTVQDDGDGFDPETVENGIGLNNIRARISAYNGKMKIHSAPGKGTEISIEIENR